MKKIFFLIAIALGCVFSAQAQVIKVYNNGALVNTYTNGGDNNYKVVVSKGNYFPGDGKTHEVVDLGLSVKWATCNVGAENPEDAGDFFSWGETSPKDIYYSTTDKYCSCPDGKTSCYDESHYTKYNSTDGKTVLDPEDDAATVNWGSGFRMPTREEFLELIYKCTWTWDSSHKGYLVAGSNGNSIFLPASGYRSGSYLYDQGSGGVCWSSTLDSYNCYSAYNLYFYSGGHYVSYGNGRYDGFPVRPVAEP